MQLATCSPNFLAQEFNTAELHYALLKTPIRIENGFITPPTAPGLGVELLGVAEVGYRLAGLRVDGDPLKRPFRLQEDGTLDETS